MVKKNKSNKIKLLLDIVKTLKLIYNANSFCFVVISIFTVAQGILPVVEISIGKNILDSIIAAAQTNGSAASIKTVAFWMAMEFAAFLTGNIIDSVKRYMQNVLGSYLTLTVNKELFTKASSLDASFFENPVFYDKLMKARQGAAQRPLQTQERIFSLIQSIITLCGLVGILFAFSPLFLFILLITTLPALNIEMFFSKKIYKIFKERVPEIRKKEYSAYILTDKWAFKELHLFKLKDFFLKKYIKIAIEHIKQDKTINRKRSFSNSLLSNFLLVIYYGLYAYVVYRTVHGIITIGSMAMYIQAIKGVQSGFRSLLQSMSALYEDNLYISDLFSFMEIKPNITSGTINMDDNPLCKDCIEFCNVSFKYPGTEKVILNNINLKIFKGQNIALVGLNGSGKTTLIKLLCRFYDPTEGTIYIDGIDIRNYDLDYLHKKVSTVFQDFMRYELSVNENIGIGNISQIDNHELIEECARKSGAHEFVSKLGKQYEEHLGRTISDGIELSMGQWQKIALSRAFMGEGDILVLDEPTASLDSETEYEIFKKFGEITKGKLAIIITHRFSTVRMADCIIVLKNGTIIEKGTHEELIDRHGEYARLYNIQALAYQT